MGGIGGLLGFVATFGFLLFLVGVALAVTSISQGRRAGAGVTLAVVGLVVGVVLSVVSRGILIVEPAQVAVVFQTVSGQLETPRRAGTHIIIPILQEATIYPIVQQQYTMSGVSEGGQERGDDAVRVRTIDGQEVIIDVTVIYRINPDDVNIVHERWQNRYENDLIRPILRGFVRDAVSRFRAEAVYGESRTVIQEAIETDMRNRMQQDGFEVTDLIIRNVTFSSEEFADSIERVQIAERQAEEAAFRVQQEEQEAERVRVRAQGARDASIAAAEGEAESIRIRALAQAEALRQISEVLQENPLLVQYEYVQKLADNVGLILLPSNSPFLFDFESLSAGTMPGVPATTTPEQ
ncbi:MAG: SPFH domain-containing protein [Anaerolineae bacterium]|jgi:regulator of protease activity HflC (stomatin/prohibitin superfamily)|nr:SPFH domain-containing protein [Anaerolineae bacterium]